MLWRRFEQTTYTVSRNVFCAGMILWLALSLVAVTARAETASEAEMTRVCANWLNALVHEQGQWAGSASPRIRDIQTLYAKDTAVGLLYSIDPAGFVLVPYLKALPPVTAYSEESNLDVRDTLGLVQLFRDMLRVRFRVYAAQFGSLNAALPKTTGVQEPSMWSLYVLDDQAFTTRLATMQPMTEGEILLGDNRWSQGDPWNLYCPADNGCAHTPVGCVATSAAQIMRYWEWPPQGQGSHCYFWQGAQNSGTLCTSFEDLYDWANMPLKCNGGCTPPQQQALAHLCYDVGVAYEMQYGCSVSGASVGTPVWTDYFLYDSWTHLEFRKNYTSQEWFDLIVSECEARRPMQFSIEPMSHALVCDGWRVFSGSQIHMNYGWGGSTTAWYFVDSIYGSDPAYEKMMVGIRPVAHAELSVRSANPASGVAMLVSPADTNGQGDGSTPFARTYSPGRLVTLQAPSTADGTNRFLKWQRDGMDYPGGTDVALSMDKDHTMTAVYSSYQGLCFNPTVNYGAGDSPSSVFAADLDGDNDIDLAAANYSNVSVLKNNGDGRFVSAVNYTAGSQPCFVFAADLDGDNHSDLAVANSNSANVSVLKNNGDGTFAAAVNYAAGSSPQSVFAADLDGDGDQDLAVANTGSDDVSILKNNGDGTFATAVSYGTGNGPRSVCAADLDGDGDQDLAVANYSSDNVSVLKNNGDGTFASRVNYGALNGPCSVFAADFDGDNDADLAVANVGNPLGYSVSVLKNNGDGTYAAAVYYAAGSQPCFVFAADLDGDGDQDLAVANYSSDNVSVLKNNGDGTFASRVNYGAGDSPSSVFAADLDGDNDIDLAAANANSGKVSVLINCRGASNPPVARDTSWSTNQGTPKAVTYLPASDPDAGQILTFAIVSGPSHGSMSGFNSATGALTYTPTGSYTGADLLTFSVCDNGVPSRCDTGTVSITVSPANHAPVARDTSWSTNQGTPKAVTYLPASDPDAGQILTFAIVSGPSHGSISEFNSGSGAFTYTPTSGYTGPDSLEFRACDNGDPSMCDTGTVRITVVNHAPVARDTSWSTNQDTPKAVTYLSASDPDAGQILTFAIVSGPSHGSISGFNSGTGALTYTPTGGYTGADLLTFSVCDNGVPSRCDTGTVNISVPGTTVEDISSGVIPTGYDLSQNYPNPFNSGTEIRFALPTYGRVTLTVYDVLGREITRLVDQDLELGVKSILWDGADANGHPVASGMYFYRLTAGTFVESKKMVLLK